LVDLADELRAPVPFSCRSATCGTCICQILEGQHLLEEPDEDEAELLELMGGRSDTRLCCQARFLAGDGVIRLRALDAATSRPGDDD
jgi:ferredoxin